MQIMGNNRQHHHMLNNPNVMNRNASFDGAYGMRQPIVGYATEHKLPGSNWRQWRNDGKMKESQSLNSRRSGNIVAATGFSNKLQFQNGRRKSFKPNKNKKFDGGRRFAPYNTTSYIMRAKKAAGVAANPPLFSPSAECLSDLVEREWGVDLYGSMKGLIRIRSPPNEDGPEVCDSGSSHTDFSKFEIVWPNRDSSPGSDNSMESGVEDTINNVSPLENENLILKEKLFVMDRDMDDLKQRIQLLEQKFRVNIDEEVKDNVSDDVLKASGAMIIRDETSRPPMWMSSMLR